MPANTALVIPEKAKDSGHNREMCLVADYT
jgi:hypothetical protein